MTEIAASLSIVKTTINLRKMSMIYSLSFVTVSKDSMASRYDHGKVNHNARKIDNLQMVAPGVVSLVWHH